MSEMTAWWQVRVGHFCKANIVPNTPNLRLASIIRGQEFSIPAYTGTQAAIP